MFPKLPPVTRNIIILNVIVYIVSNFFYKDLYDIFSAFYPESPNFRIWQIITHMFMHASLGDGVGIAHIAFNMMTLWSFGPVLEQTLGEKKYFILYFLSGIGAFFLFNLWNFYEVNLIASQLADIGVNVASARSGGDISILEQVKSTNEVLKMEKIRELKGIFEIPMVGASGAIFGVVTAFATLFPNAKLFIMFIPFPVKAKYLLPAVIIISVYLGYSGNVGGVAHFAHVGGALVGFLLARSWKKYLFRFK